MGYMMKIVRGELGSSFCDTPRKKRALQIQEKSSSFIPFLRQGHHSFSSVPSPFHLPFVSKFCLAGSAGATSTAPQSPASPKSSAPSTPTSIWRRSHVWRAAVHLWMRSTMVTKRRVIVREPPEPAVLVSVLMVTKRRVIVRKPPEPVVLVSVPMVPLGWREGSWVHPGGCNSIRRRPLRRWATALVRVVRAESCRPRISSGPPPSWGLA